MDHMKEMVFNFSFVSSFYWATSIYFHTLPAVADTVLTLTLAKLRLNQWPSALKIA